MATKKAGGEKSAPLSPQVANKLLDLLSSDNEFRRLFKKDPVAALAKVGYAPAKEKLAERKKQPVPPRGSPQTAPRSFDCDCLQVDRIAPKAEIMAARSLLKSYLAAPFVFLTPHCFEAGKVASTLRRK